jgi:hypothetical protein
MDDERQIRWVGSVYDDLLAFPKDAARNRTVVNPNKEKK